MRKPVTVGAGRNGERARGCASAADCGDADGHSTVPAGEVAVICVAELTVKLAALVLPNFTAVAPCEAGAGDDDAGTTGCWP